MGKEHIALLENKRRMENQRHNRKESSIKSREVARDRGNRFNDENLE